MCAGAHLLQGRQRGVAVREIEPPMGEVERGQMPQSHILRQRKTLGQTRLLALVEQLLDLRLQTKICSTQKNQMDA